MFNFFRKSKAAETPPLIDKDAMAALVRGDDPLLACLGHVALRLGQPFSARGATEGLPLRDGRLSVDLFPRAAERIGLKARLFKRDLRSIPSMVVPFIILFANGDACVVVEKRARRGRVRVIFPSVSEKPRWVSLKSLQSDASGFVFYLASVSEARPEINNGNRRLRGHWLWSTVRRFWPSWIQVFFAAFIINLLGLAIPLFVMNVYDRVIPNLAYSTLWALTAGVLIALAFDFLLKQLRTIVLDATGRRVDMAVSAKLFEQSLGIKMAERGASTGAIASQVREFESVRDFFTSSSIIAITDFLFIGIFIGVLWMIVGPVAYVPTLAVPVVIILTLLAQAPLMHALDKSQVQSARRHGVLVESLVGVETLKAIGGENAMQRRWEDAAAAGARAQSGARFWSSFIINLTGSVQQLVSVVVVAWGVFFVADGSITIGGLIAANILSGRLLAPLGNIAQTLARAQTAFAAVRGLSGMMALPSDEGGGVRMVEDGSISFKKVSFSYPGARNTSLDDVTFSVDAGDRVGVVGRIGSGKTTLGRLMAGLYEASSGSIEIDGADLNQYGSADLRADVGFLSQEPELFAGSIRENIILGYPLATETEIDEAVKLAGVDSFTASHPLGLQMPVGERGRGISGGQRQAVALARILIRKPKILFLDETSGSMDTAFEAGLMQRLNAHRKGEMTLFVCSHRNTFLALVDRLLVIDGGRLVADGPKDDVMNALSGKPVSASPPQTKPTKPGRSTNGSNRTAPKRKARIKKQTDG